MRATEAAARLGHSYNTVLRWLGAGYLHGVREGRHWEISEDELERLGPRHRKPGKPGSPDHMRNIAALGGQALVKGGTDMQERGSRGGQKTVATLGVDHMRAIGGKGGSKSLGTKRPRTARGLAILGDGFGGQTCWSQDLGPHPRQIGWPHFGQCRYGCFPQVHRSVRVTMPQHGWA